MCRVIIQGITGTVCEDCIHRGSPEKANDIVRIYCEDKHRYVTPKEIVCRPKIEPVVTQKQS